MVKYKIGFVVTAEILFSLLAKFLPVEDLHVEEIAPVPVRDPVQRKLAQQFVRDVPKLKRKHPSKPLDLNAGINKIIMELLADGQPHKALELRPLLEAEGFSGNSATSRLLHLEKHGIVVHFRNGSWALTARSESESA